jgi:hypothetical protein
MTGLIGSDQMKIEIRRKQRYHGGRMDALDELLEAKIYNCY